MEILQLKYFCSAAETQDFLITAKKFSVPVSNISQTVKRLEKELEGDLGLHLFRLYPGKDSLLKILF